jgi:uncharacterized membrane protein
VTEPAAEVAPPWTRMAAALLALIGLLVAGYLSLHRAGLIGSLQCTVGGCEVVQSSRYAVFAGIPVAYLGLVAYVGILGLALVGVQPRWVHSRGLSLLIFLGAAVGVAFSAYLTYLEAAVIHAWCQWCVISAILITLIFLVSCLDLARVRRV